MSLPFIRTLGGIAAGSRAATGIAALLTLAACSTDTPIEAVHVEARFARAGATVATPSFLMFRSAPGAEPLHVATTAPRLHAWSTDPNVCGVSPATVSTRMVAGRWGNRERIGTFQVAALRSGTCRVVLTDGRKVLQEVPVEVWSRLGTAPLRLEGSLAAPGGKFVHLVVGLSQESGCASTACGALLFEESLILPAGEQVLDLDATLPLMELLTDQSPDYLFAYGSSPSVMVAGMEAWTSRSSCGTVDFSGCGVRALRLRIDGGEATGESTYAVWAELEVLGMP